MASIDGLISGLNTTQIITQLMAVERSSGRYLLQAKSASQSMAGVLQALNTAVSALRTKASAFVPDTVTGQSAWQLAAAASSNTSLATAVAGSGAVPGSATFAVTSVATAGAVASSGTVGSTGTAVADGPILLAKGAGRIGFSGFDAGATLAAGQHTVQVTQASAGASLSGGASLGGSITIDATNNTVSVYLDGSTTPTTITLNSGTYSPDQLAAEVQRAASGALAASVNTDGTLRLTSTHEGSAASLQLAAANSTLGLSDTTTVATGTDAVVSVDGVANTVTSVKAGSQVTLTGANGDSVVGTLAGGIRTGSAALTQVDLANGATLADVVAAVNASGAGVSAAAVQVSSGAYLLQLTSTTTGAGSDITLDSTAFPSALSTLGAMQQLQAGADTVLRVGTGPGAYDVTSSTTSVTGLLAGVTITAVKADPASAVTVTVSSDTAGIANSMESLVTAINGVLSFISDKAGYDADSKTSGPLLGNSLVRDLARRVGDAVIGTSASTPGVHGVTVTRDGSVSFDRAAFLDAYAKDPAAVSATMTTMAGALAGLAKDAADPVDGYVTAQIKAEQDSVRDYGERIAAFEDRMLLRQGTLQTQYAALERMLGSLQAQSQWLAGQLASLATLNDSGK